jgi:uncharacterized protein YkwD
VGGIALTAVKADRVRSVVRGVFVSVPMTCVLAAAAASSPAAAASPCAHASASPAKVSSASASRALRCLLNRERARHGLRAVRFEPRLQRAARAHAADMAARDYFSHVSPEGSTLDDRVRRTGYLDRVARWTIGEAIAWGARRLGSPRAILRGLLDSPPHRAILLDPSFRDVGVGVAHGAPMRGLRGALTFALDFGRATRGI